VVKECWMDSAEREALASLCEELPGLRAECAQLSEHHGRLLERIVAEAVARRPILHLIHELVGSTSEEFRHALSTGLPGQGVGRANEEWFGCPDGACGRKAVTYPAGPVPRCRVTGLVMSRQQL
jgi:hypothetical protein